MNLYRKDYLSLEDRETIKEAITGEKSEYLKDRQIPEGFECPKNLRKTLEKLNGIGYYEKEIIYWRKANAIHGWFARNCESINDDVEINVTFEDLEHLLSDINKVLKTVKWTTKNVVISTRYSKDGATKEYGDIKVLADTSVAEKLLPVTEGFFFGSYEYDEYYVECLNRTKDALERTLKESDEYDEFVYTASY